MTQNIYDNPDFFAGYGQLGRSVAGLDGAVEWPALRAMLPPVAGLRILDIGCGYGWFARWARAAGATAVVGMDVSDRMLEKARAMTQDPAVRYDRADAENLVLPAAAFDLVYSALVLHYITHAERLLRSVHTCLRPGGTFVFSMEHPIYTAPTMPGWTTAADGRRVWPLDGYGIEGPRVTDWLVKGVVKQHRTIGTVLNALIRCGFTLTHLEEWAPTAAQIAARADLGPERERPMFLLVSARA